MLYAKYSVQISANILEIIFLGCRYDLVDQVLDKQAWELNFWSSESMGKSAVPVGEREG